MEQYTIIKSFVMFMAIVGGFSFFFLKVRHLYQLMLSVQGQTEFKLDRVRARVLVLFKDILGQANVRRKTMPGLAHTLIFFGFLAALALRPYLQRTAVLPATDGDQPKRQFFMDLGMPGMKMGPNQVKMEMTAPGIYKGTGIIVRCPSGKTIWQAMVNLPGKGNADFIFDVILM